MSHEHKVIACGPCQVPAIVTDKGKVLHIKCPNCGAAKTISSGTLRPFVLMEKKPMEPLASVVPAPVSKRGLKYGDVTPVEKTEPALA